MSTRIVLPFFIIKVTQEEVMNLPPEAQNVQTAEELLSMIRPEVPIDEKYDAFSYSRWFDKDLDLGIDEVLWLWGRGGGPGIPPLTRGRTLVEGVWVREIVLQPQEIIQEEFEKPEWQRRIEQLVDGEWGRD